MKMHRRHITEWLWVIGLTIGMAYIVLAFASMARAASTTDFAYRTPFAVQNGGSDFTGGYVCVPTNPSGLAAQSFMGSDGLDAAAFDQTATELTLVRTDPTSSDTCWFPFIGSISAGATATNYIYSGGTDNPQRAYIPTGSTVSAEDASAIDPLAGENEITLWLDSVTFDALPGSTLNLFDKSGSYGVQLLANGNVKANVTLSAGTCATHGPSYTFSSTLTADSTYDLMISMRARGSVATCSYYMTVVDHTGGGSAIYASSGETCTSCAIANSSNPLILSAPTGVNVTIGGARMGQGYYSNPPTEQMAWDFTDLTTLTASANGSEWDLVADDQDGGDNDGTWHNITSGTSNLTITASALQVITTGTAVATVSSDLPDVIGTIPTLSTATDSSDGFSGDDGLASAIEFTGMETGTAWFLLALVLSIGIGIPIVRATAGWVGAVWMGFAMGVPAVLDWYGWAWVAVGGFLCFGAAGISALMGKR